jgi:hypothetical protein
LKYEVGDKIIVLISDEDGKVVEIINEKMVMIEVRGVKFPAYMDQIDFPYFKMFSQKKIVEKKQIYIDDIRKEKITVKKKVADGVFINFLPVFDKDVFEDDVVEKLKVFIINYNEEEYHFKYNLLFNNESHFELESSVRGLSDFYLHDIKFEDISDSPNFNFVFSLVNENKKKAPFYERSLKIRGKQFFKKIEEIQEKNEPSFSFEIFIEYPERVEEEKVDLSKLGNAGFRVYEASKAKDYLPPARSVVDLHIEKITDNWSHLSNHEILTIQLNEFEKYFHLAELHHLPSIIMIHGIGEGKLRDEIHELLRFKKSVKYFVNQYHHLYGFGATEIFFKV